MILIELYRQHAGNKTYTNLPLIMLTGYDHMVGVVKLHEVYLFISCYLGALL